MNILTFSQKIETATPTGYTFWAGHTREAYNMEKTISDTMLLVLPNPYPAQWRAGCSYTVDFSLWFGKMYEIYQSTTRTQQHNPYSAIEERKNMHDIVNDTMAMINADEAIAITEVQPIQFYDSPDGASVNRQVWAEVRIKAKVYNITGFDYDFDFNFD